MSRIGRRVGKTRRHMECHTRKLMVCSLLERYATHVSGSTSFWYSKQRGCHVEFVKPSRAQNLNTPQSPRGGFSAACVTRVRARLRDANKAIIIFPLPRASRREWVHYPFLARLQPSRSFLCMLALQRTPSMRHAKPVYVASRHAAPRGDRQRTSLCTQ